MASGKIEKPTEISVVDYWFDNYSINANSDAYQDFDVSAEVGTKTLLGIIGVDQYNASSGGGYTSYCVLRRFIKLDNTHIRIAFRNTSSNKAKIAGSVGLLCSN